MTAYGGGVLETDAKAERELLAWALSGPSVREYTTTTAPADAGEDQDFDKADRDWRRMEAEPNPNAIYHDGRNF